jgi:transcription antitermination protein NusB
MADSPLKARRAALRILYSIDLADMSADQALENARQTLADAGDDPAAYWQGVVSRVRGVVGKQADIDAEIKRLSPSWRLDRMACVDRNLLRLGIFEILEEITPPLIAINACVELAKEFGTASTPGFINGLLDQLCQDHHIEISSGDATA